jgi:hypothetical protein
MNLIFFQIVIMMVSITSLRGTLIIMWVKIFDIISSILGDVVFNLWYWSSRKVLKILSGILKGKIGLCHSGYGVKLFEIWNLLSICNLYSEWEFWIETFLFFLLLALFKIWFLRVIRSFQSSNKRFWSLSCWVMCCTVFGICFMSKKFYFSNFFFFSFSA